METVCEFTSGRYYSLCKSLAKPLSTAEPKGTIWEELCSPTPVLFLKVGIHGLGSSSISTGVVVDTARLVLHSCGILAQEWIDMICNINFIYQD